LCPKFGKIFPKNKKKEISSLTLRKNNENSKQTFQIFFWLIKKDKLCPLPPPPPKNEKIKNTGAHDDEHGIK
jgi:hypothetical protein